MLKPIKVGINGTGRTGLIYFRSMQPYVREGLVEIVTLNHYAMKPHELAYLIKYDSVHGRYKGTVTHDDEHVIVDGCKSLVTNHSTPLDIPWKEYGVDIVFESTGKFRKAHDKKGGYLDHIDNGAKYVIISAPPKDEFALDLEKIVEDGRAPSVVLGVNYNRELLEKFKAISNASCTTNCAAPPLSVLNKHFTILDGELITVHAYTGDQRITDGYHWDDMARGRAAALNIIPTTSGVNKTIGNIIPDLRGKLSAMAYRVDVGDGSVLHFYLTLEQSRKKEEINKVLVEACENELKGIMACTNDKIVSSDIVNDPHSCIIRLDLTKVEDHRVRVVAFYSNEFAYCIRSAELTLDVVNFLNAKMGKGTSPKYDSYLV